VALNRIVDLSDFNENPSELFPNYFSLLQSDFRLDNDSVK